MYIRKMGFSTISQAFWEAMVGVVGEGGRHNQVSKGEVEILKYYY